MMRIFRAFVWMRLRVLVNSLEQTGARDTLERFNVATEKLGSIIALVLLIPSTLGLFVLGMSAGFFLAQGHAFVTLTIVRYFLIAVTVVALVGPIMLPLRDSGSVVRYLLLPIPRLQLYLAQMAGALADPWILLVVPLAVLGIPIGLAIGLDFVAAALAFAAAVAFLIFAAGLTSLVTSVIHLLLRDRRRGDIVMFVLVFTIPAMALLPQMLVRESRGPGGRQLTRAERRALPPSAVAQGTLRLAPYLPSEMYRRTAAGAVSAPAGALVPLAELGAIALFVQAAGFAAYRRVLDMPVSLSVRRAGSFGGLWNRVVPGLSPGASAVAFTQLRLALRTPRGRATMATPLLMPLLLGVVASRRGGMAIPGVSGDHGLPLAAAGVFASILALLPLAMNQFAIDRAGFTRHMLSPISVGEILAGKAAGNAMIAAMPATLCVILTAIVFGIEHPLLWLSLLLAFAATYAVLSPVAAALSALLPKAVDLNSIGSNAHPGAGVLGMLSFALSAAPSILLTLVTINWLRRPELVPVVLLVWLAIAIGVGYLLFIPVRRLVASRCETLAQYY
ncbi:MAG TPA: hypothetical protein VGI12_03320 [Vicinamibacterales bacterium]|jgi:hypothetical protein